MKNPILKRFLKNKAATISAIILILIILIAIFGPYVCKYDPLEQNLVEKYAKVSWEHPLGTDSLGRDILTRLIYGARVSLTIAFSGVFIGSFFGIILGTIAGYYGGAIDAVISRIMDVLLAFPGILLAIVIVAILGNGTYNTIIAIAIFSIPTTTRIIRGNVMTLRDSEYVQACKVMGRNDFDILFKHIIPNTSSLIIVNVTLDLGSSILTSSSLSFLGMGVQAPNPEWGAMLSTGREVLRSYPLAVLAPGFVITIVVLAFSLVGDGLRDALDPKLKNR